MFKYISFGPYPNLQTVHDQYNYVIQPDRNFLLFAIFDKTKLDQHGVNEDQDRAFAGVISYIKSEPQNLATEIGTVLILPPFQRTHVASNAVGLLLKYALDLPMPSQPADAIPAGAGGSKSGLGLRRVVWQANVLNTASLRLAERMGFTLVGICRWDRVLPSGKEGNGLKTREGDPRAGCPGRDSAVLAICWDEWEDGVKDKVARIMERKS